MYIVTLYDYLQLARLHKQYCHLKSSCSVVNYDLQDFIIICNLRVTLFICKLGDFINIHNMPESITTPIIHDWFVVCSLRIVSIFCFKATLILSRRRPLSYRNQSIDWFLYDNGLRLERVKRLN